MKKTIGLVILVLVMVSAAKSQICHTCSEQVQKEKDTVAAREQRAKEVADHNTWPARPQLFNWSGAKYAGFKAKFLFANETTKKIKQVTWECTLLTLDTKQTIATYIVVSKINIAPHKTANLSEQVMVPLTLFYGSKVVSANEPKKPQDKLPDVVQAEQINQIKEIQYADGSVDRP